MFSYIRYVRLNGRYDFKVTATDGIAAGSIGLGGMQVNNNSITRCNTGVHGIFIHSPY